MGAVFSSGRFCRDYVGFGQILIRGCFGKLDADFHLIGEWYMGGYHQLYKLVSNKVR